LELQNLIKELLAKYNYISLPGLGSFVQSYHSAKLSPDGNEFLPPQQTIAFDTSRTFNDEVLEKLIMERMQVKQPEAAEKVKEFVEVVKKAISSGEGMFFLNVGTLKKNRRDSIVLIEVEDKNKVSSTFGLNPISVSGKSEEKVSPIIAPSPSVVKPLPRKPLGRKGKNIAIAALAAVIFVGLFISALYVFVPEFRFWEQNIAKTPLTLKQVEPEVFLDDDLIEEEYENTLDNDIATIHDLNKTLDNQVDKRKALFYEEMKDQDTKTYYIISGSYVNLENAQNYYNDLKKKGYNPELLQEDGRYRVALSKFTDRNRALRELERLRREKPTEAVWLLGI